MPRTPPQYDELARFAGGIEVSRSYPRSGDKAIASWEFPDGTYFRKELWRPDLPGHAEQMMMVMEALAKIAPVDITVARAICRITMEPVVGAGIDIMEPTLADAVCSARLALLTPGCIQTSALTPDRSNLSQIEWGITLAAIWPLCNSRTGIFFKKRLSSISDRVCMKRLQAAISG